MPLISNVPPVMDKTPVWVKFPDIILPFVIDICPPDCKSIVLAVNWLDPLLEVNKPEDSIVRAPQTAAGILITGSLVTSGIVTASEASGIPADQLPASSQSESTFPVQLVWAFTRFTNANKSAKKIILFILMCEIYEIY